MAFLVVDPLHPLPHRLGVLFVPMAMLIAFVSSYVPASIELVPTYQEWYLRIGRYLGRFPGIEGGLTVTPSPTAP